MKKISSLSLLSLVISHSVFVISVSAQPVEPAGCFSNGVCTEAEARLKCPDCAGVLESSEGYETESEAKYEFNPPQDSGVTLPVVSQSPTPVPVVEEPFSFTPFILLLVFMVIGLIIGYILLRKRNADIPPQQ